MNRHHDGGRWQVIPATLLLALFLNVIPLPEWMKFARPDWVTLTLFYWCVATPQRVGVGVGWVMGMLLDLLHYTLFGQHALGKVLLALIALGVYQRLNLYPMWKQCMVILLISSVDIGIVAGIHHLANGVEIRLLYWQAALTTALLWPVAYIVLRKIRHRSGITRR